MDRHFPPEHPVDRIEVLSYANGREAAYGRIAHQSEHFKARGEVASISDVQRMLDTLWAFTINHQDTRFFREIELYTEHITELRKKARDAI